MLLMAVASDSVYSNWKALSLLSEPKLSKRLYSTLLEEQKLLVQALSELLVNADVLGVTIKKRESKTFERGSAKKKRELLSTNRYRKEVVPKLCREALIYLKDGSG